MRTKGLLMAAAAGLAAALAWTLAGEQASTPPPQPEPPRTGPPNTEPPSAEPPRPATPDLTGKQLAQMHCAGCHFLPSPELLPKQSWEPVLAYMGMRLGMRDVDYLKDDPEYVMGSLMGRQSIEAREGLLPEEPLLSDREWARLRNYYIDGAPERAVPQAERPAVDWELPDFEIVTIDYAPATPVTTLVHVRAERAEIYLGDSHHQTLTILDADGKIRMPPSRLIANMSPVNVAFRDGRLFIGSIGDLAGALPGAARPGFIAAVEMRSGGEQSVVLDGLYRMADFAMGDLNGDRLEDLVVCGFGSSVGRLSWFEAREGGAYEEHVLLDRPGAVKAQIHDFDGDGDPDVAALMADARESMHIFENQGDGTFADHMIFETHASYGHTYFELHDFDGDGRKDLLVTNGDNVDSGPYNARKNYHGVRVYLDRGDYRFDEAFFYPMHGAYIAKAADFDGDGDLDIAAIAFYPDFGALDPESFVLLTNDGKLQFSAHSDRRLNEGRWMTMDVGDIDGDHDPDVVLGAAYIPIGMAPYLPRFIKMTKQGPAALILRNTH